MTPYRVSPNSTVCTNFRTINFRSRHRLRKYFFNENFQIYGILVQLLSYHYQ